MWFSAWLRMYYNPKNKSFIDTLIFIIVVFAVISGVADFIKSLL